MLPVIILAIIFAKIKKYDLSVLTKAYALFPFFCVEIVYWCFQISVFCGSYVTLQYATYLKNAYLYLLIIPIIAYQLYKPALVGSGFIITGTFLNELVMKANNGLMPVYPTVSKWIGYFNESAITSSQDTIHCIGTAQTKLKILTDYIDVGFSVLSIGDLLIRAFVFIIIFYSIKELHKRKNLT